MIDLLLDNSLATFFSRLLWEPLPGEHPQGRVSPFWLWVLELTGQTTPLRVEEFSVPTSQHLATQVDSSELSAPEGTQLSV